MIILWGSQYLTWNKRLLILNFLCTIALEARILQLSMEAWVFKYMLPISLKRTSSRRDPCKPWCWLFSLRLAEKRWSSPGDSRSCVSISFIQVSINLQAGRERRSTHRCTSFFVTTMTCWCDHWLRGFANRGRGPPNCVSQISFRPWYCSSLAIPVQIH